MHVTFRIADFRYLQDCRSHWVNVCFLVILIASSFLSDLNAEEQDVTFQRISLEQGLSQSIVESIVQDSRGFMWFATEDGLNIYDGYGFTVIRNVPDDPNSLSYNQIKTIYEDRSGGLWIGTYNGGLNRYDLGTEQFQCYQNDPNDQNSLSHNIVWAIYEDSKGTLWIGTDGGLNRFVPNKTEGGAPTFIRYQNDPNNPNSLSHDVVRAIYEDSDGSLWIGTDGGLNKLLPNKAGGGLPTFIRYQNDPNNPNSLSHNIIRAIYEDRNGTLWIGTDGGLNKLVFDTSGDENEELILTFIRYQNDPRDQNSLSHDEVHAIYEDRTGVFWIGTNGGGLNQFDREEETFTSFQNDPWDLNSLSYDETRCIYEDRSGVLWIGTYGGGINKVNRGRKQFVHYKPDPDDPNSLNEEIIWCIYEDRSGVLWIGTHGGGLNKFDRRKNQFTHYRLAPNDPHTLSSDIVRLVLEDRSGVLWIGTNGGGINSFDKNTGKFTSYQHNPDDPNSLSHDEIRALYEDRSGTLWIGTRGGGLNKLIPSNKAGIPPTFVHYRHDPNNPNSLSNDFIRAIYEDISGVLWIGTQGGGLNKFDRDTGRFTHYRADPNDLSSLSNDYIFSIYEDSADGGSMLWVGTWGGGLNRFDRGRGTFTFYTEKDGLPNDAVYGILEDNQGNLWFSTNNGLSKFNPGEETFRNYTVEDGLQSKEFNGGSFFKSRSGEMFFGGINGFNAFYPENINDNPYIPPVVITAFQKLNKKVKFDRPISEIKELRLSHKDYVFSFEFAALDYTVPEKNKYAYKMEELDKDWIYTDSNKRFASYTTLAPGKYVFRVRGSNNDGVWNEEGASIKIIITPPFWKTWWFRSFSALIVLVLALAGYQRRLKNVRMKAELQAAHDAQMSIMPQSDPQIRGFDISGVCIPAHEVGGDFFDYIWLDPEKTKFGVAVGDVSGKAMKAAMTAIMSSGMIYSVVNETNSVKEILTRINRPLYYKTDKNMFTALCLVSLDARTKELTFTNAGLNEPLLKTNGSVTYLKCVGPKFPLGSIKDSNYGEKKTRLKSGDVFILFTDGVVEARNHSKTFYGYDTLKNLLEKMDTPSLSATEIKQRIIEDTKRFSNGTPQYDDMTVVVIKAV